MRTVLEYLQAADRIDYAVPVIFNVEGDSVVVRDSATGKVVKTFPKNTKTKAFHNGQVYFNTQPRQPYSCFDVYKIGKDHKLRNVEKSDLEKKNVRQTNTAYTSEH